MTDSDSSDSSSEEDDKRKAKGEKGEECQLGLPMTELVRRADVLERSGAAQSGT